MIRVTSDHFPLVVVEVWDDMTFDDVEVQRGAYDELHARNRRFVLLVEARGVKVPSSPVRRALGDLSNGYEALARKNIICMQFVISSKLVVGALQAVRWFIKADLEMGYSASAVDAFEQARTRAAPENVVLPGLDFMRALDAKHS